MCYFNFHYQINMYIDLIKIKMYLSILKKHTHTNKSFPKYAGYTVIKHHRHIQNQERKQNKPELHAWTPMQGAADTSLEVTFFSDSHLSGAIKRTCLLAQVDWSLSKLNWSYPVKLDHLSWLSFEWLGHGDQYMKIWCWSPWWHLSQHAIPEYFNILVL